MLDDLIGYHLDLCEPVERAAVETAMDRSGDMRRYRQALDHLLRPLAVYDVRQPSGLVDGILRRVPRRHTIRFPGAGGRALDPAEAATASHSSWTLRDLFSLAAAIVLFVGVLVPGYENARQAAWRSACNDRMRQVGAALGSYVQAHNGMLPFTTAGVAASWRPDRLDPLPRASENLRVLQQANYVSSGRWLNCPGEPDGSSRGTTRYNFQLFLVPQRQSSLPGRLPIVSDPNPLVRDGCYQPGDGLRNSDAHGFNAGQMVLYLDGSAAWRAHPTVGLDGDDIFRINDPNAFSGPTARSVSDAFLIP